MNRHDRVSGTHTRRTVPVTAFTVMAASSDTYWLETFCSGCQQWESLAAPAAALTAYRQGALAEHQAFPDLTFTQKTLIECRWHRECWDHAVRHQLDPITHA